MEKSSKNLISLFGEKPARGLPKPPKQRKVPWAQQYSILYLLEMEVCTAREEVYSAGVEDRQYMKKRVVLLQI
jgi:hypothetical protein